MNQVEAITSEVESIAEEQSKEIDLIIYLKLDGMPNCNTQEKEAIAFRAGKLMQKCKHGLSLSHFFYDNPKAKPVIDDTSERETLKTVTETLDIQVDEASVCDYSHYLNRAKRSVEEILVEYCNDMTIEAIKCHIIVFGFNQGDALSNFLVSLGTYDSKSIKNEISKLTESKIFKHKKVKDYICLEHISLLDPVGNGIDTLGVHSNFVDGKNDLGNAVKSNGHKDFDSIEAMAIELIKLNKNIPTQKDIQDFVYLCQNTYYIQTPLERSVVDFAAGNNDDDKERENRQKTRERLSSSDWKWKEVSDSQIDMLLNSHEIHKELKSATNGFYSKLYVKYESEGNYSKYAYCTCGTNFTSVIDWFNNVTQGLIGISSQYTQSVKIAKLLDKSIPQKDVLFFIGHSLGGGLASNNALVTKNRHAVTFNAAGLNFLRVLGTLLVNNREALFQVNKRKRRIHAFVIHGEILNTLLRPFAESAYGTVRTLEENYFEENTIGNLGKGARHALTNFYKVKSNDVFSVINYNE